MNEPLSQSENAARKAWEVLCRDYPELLKHFEESPAPIQEAFETGFRVAMVSIGIEHWARRKKKL